MSRLIDIVDIVGLITSQDYKDRFLGEYTELAIRHEKLTAMLHRLKAGTLEFQPTCPAELLERQAEVMKQYMDILEERATIEEVDLDI